MTDEILSDEDVFGTPAAPPKKKRAPAPDESILSDEDVFGVPADPRPSRGHRVADATIGNLTRYAREAAARGVPNDRIERVLKEEANRRGYALGGEDLILGHAPVADDGLAARAAFAGLSKTTPYARGTRPHPEGSPQNPIDLTGDIKRGTYDYGVSQVPMGAWYRDDTGRVVQRAPSGVGERISAALGSGVLSPIGGAARAVGDLATIKNMAGGDKLTEDFLVALTGDPFGQVGEAGADITDASQLAMQWANAGLHRPEHLAVEAFTDPANALPYGANIVAQSVPAMAGALAMRNPAAAQAAIGAFTGAQQYGEDRAAGDTPLVAGTDAATAGSLEAALEGLVFPRLLAPARGAPGRQFLDAILAEGGQEAITNPAQYIAGQVIHGKDVDPNEATRQAEEGAVAGMTMGGAVRAPFTAAEVLSPQVDPALLQRNAAAIVRQAQELKNAQPKLKPDQVAAYDQAERTRVPGEALVHTAPLAVGEAARAVQGAANATRPATPARAEPVTAPGPAEAVLDGLAPRVPETPTLEPGVTLEQLQAEHAAAQTNETRAAAAARIAAFKQQEKQRGTTEAEEGPRQEAPQGAEGVQPEAARRDAGQAPAVQQGPVAVYARTSEIPADVRARNNLNSQANAGVEGFYDPTTGQAHVIEANLDTSRMSRDARMAWVVAHERSGHAGLRGAALERMDGDINAGRGELFRVLDRAASNPIVAHVALATANEYQGQDLKIGRELAVEEALAELQAAVVTGNYDEIESRYGIQVPHAQRDNLRGLFERLVQAMKRAFGGKHAGEFTDGDVYQLLKDARRFAKSGKVTPTSAPRADTVASRASMLEDISSKHKRNIFNDREFIVGGALVELNRMPGGGENDAFLSSIRTLEPGKGLASAALNEIAQLADEHGVTMRLIAAPFGKDGGLNKKQLEAWYARAGFEKQGQYMVRTPKAGTESLPERKTGMGEDGVLRLGGTFREPDVIASRKPLTPSRTTSALLRNLTPLEQKKITDKTAEAVVEMMRKLPSAREMAAVAIAGQAKRGWYAGAVQTISDIFGPEAPRFAAFLAALSPRTSVENNADMAIKAWAKWTAEGRPQDRDDIVRILRESGDFLATTYPNAIESLTAANPVELVLSGPKVDSFMRNLLGDVEQVTNDGWMSVYAAMPQTIFKGGKTKFDPGKGTGYLAMNARTREAAAMLTKLTGETWSPAEVQETVWSWTKLAYELAESAGEFRTIPELVADGEIRDELLLAIPDFASLFAQPRYADILKEVGYGDQVERVQRAVGNADGAAREEPAARVKAKPFAEADQKRLEARAAERIEGVRQARKDEAAAKRSAPAEDDVADVPFSRARPTINIGLDVPTGGKVKTQGALAAIRATGAKVVEHAVHVSDTEPTLVAVLDRPLTKEEGDALSVELKQEAIAQRNADGTGDLFGPKASDWGPYNPGFFLELDGRRASESDVVASRGALKPSDYRLLQTLSRARRGDPLTDAEKKQLTDLDLGQNYGGRTVNGITIPDGMWDLNTFGDRKLRELVEANRAAGQDADAKRDLNPRRDRAPVDDHFHVNEDESASILASRGWHAKKPQPDAVTVTAVHYSTSPSLKEIDPRKAGTGGASAERRRFGMGEFGKQGGTAARVNFYVQDGDELPQRERGISGLGEHPYRVTLTNLYDLDADPRDLADRNVDVQEENISEAGFDGYVAGAQSGIDSRVAVVFDIGKKKIPVEPVIDLANVPVFSRKPAKYKAEGGDAAWIAMADAGKWIDFGPLATLEQVKVAAAGDFEEIGTAGSPLEDVMPYVVGVMNAPDNLGHPELRRIRERYGDDPQRVANDFLPRMKSLHSAAMKANLDYLDLAHSDNPMFQSAMLRATLYGMDSTTVAAPPALLPNAVAAARARWDSGEINSIKKLRSVYMDAAKEAAETAAKSGNTIQGLEGGAWFELPKVDEKDSAATKQEKLATWVALSDRNWCTSRGNERVYAPQGPMYVYRKNGESLMAIRFVGDQVAEIQSQRNDGTIPPEYLEEVKNFSKHANLSERAKTTIARAERKAAMLRQLDEMAEPGAKWYLGRLPLKDGTMAVRSEGPSRGPVMLGPDDSVVIASEGNNLHVDGDASKLRVVFAEEAETVLRVNAPALEQVHGGLVTDGHSTPKLEFVSGQLIVMAKNGSFPSLVRVGNISADYGSFPKLTTVDYDAFLDNDAIAPALEVVGGHANIHNAASARNLKTVGGSLSITISPLAEMDVAATVGGNVSLKGGTFNVKEYIEDVSLFLARAKGLKTAGRVFADDSSLPDLVNAEIVTMRGGSRAPKLQRVQELSATNIKEDGLASLFRVDGAAHVNNSSIPSLKWAGRLRMKSGSDLRSLAVVAVDAQINGHNGNLDSLEVVGGSLDLEGQVPLPKLRRIGDNLSVEDRSEPLPVEVVGGEPLLYGAPLISDDFASRKVKFRVGEQEALLGTPLEYRGDVVASRRAGALARFRARLNQANVYNAVAAQGVPQGTPSLVAGRLVGIRDGIDALREKLQDKMLRVLRVQEQATQPLTDAMDAHTLENLMHGRAADQLKLADRDFVLKLTHAMRRTGVSLDQLQDVLLALHAPERNAKIATINQAFPDGGAGISTADARGILAGTVAGPYSGKKLTPDTITKARNMAAIVQQMRHRTIDILEQSHQITPALARTLRSTYQHYVPLRGLAIDDVFPDIMGTGKGLSHARPNIKRALGRTTLAQNILGEAIGDLQRAIVQAEKARVTQAFLKFAIANPMPDLFTVSPVDLEWKFSEATGEAYLGVRSEREDADRSMIVPLNGKPVRIRFEDPRLRDAMMNLSINDMGGFVKIFGAINRWRSAVLTRFNPGFAPVNAVRDAIFGINAVSAELGPKIAAQTIIGYAPAFKALMIDSAKVRGNAQATNKTWDDWAREYTETGAKTGLAQAEQPRDLQKKLSIASTTIMRLAAEGKPIRAAQQALARAGTPILHAIEYVNDATENALRLSVYVALRKSGKSAQQAAGYAKNVTINFNRKGHYGPVINSLYLFYNASMQGSHAVFRVIKKPQVQATLGFFAGLQFMLAAAMMGDDDDDGISSWDAIPDYVKRTSLVIPLGTVTGGKMDYFALPMPYGFNLFPYAGGRLAQFIHQGSRPTDSSVGADMVKSATEAFSPVPVDEGYSSIFGDQVAFLLQLAANKDDLGRPIVQDSGFEQYPVPAALKGRADTPRAYQVMSQLLAKAGGGDLEKRVAPTGYLDIAPEQIEAVVNYLSGGPGSLLNKGAKWWDQLDAGNLQEPMDVIGAAPIASRFVDRPEIDKVIAERYYGERGELARNLDVLKEKVRRGEEPEKALAEVQADEAGMSGVDFARYKRPGKKGQKVGDIKRSETGAPQVEAKFDSAFEQFKAAEKVNEDVGRAIRNLRDPSTTNADAQLLLEAAFGESASDAVADAQLGAPAEVLNNRSRQRAIKLLQQKRMQNQRAFLARLHREREQ